MIETNIVCDVIVEKSFAIKAIDRKTVHRICSGQVVLSLATAVKELIENSIDAGSTRIDVRLKEYGSDFIEVADNGCGVRKEYFQALTLKHYTSKIREFSDLENVSSLGFRGEALSSLCALADLTVISRHKSAEWGTKLTYDHNGTVTSEVPFAREEGTTVTLSNLFSTLPVRRKEFTKNLKREFNKMCQLLYAYCLVCKGIRFSCTNQTNRNTNNVVATEGASTIRENIISIFGTKQLSTLIDVELTKPDEIILKEYEMQLISDENLPFSFEFIISSVTHGHGRSSTDRQFYYVNSRPCEFSKVGKLINEIYQKNHVDVNVTPDKRQVFVAKERLLLATLKASLLKAFKVFPSTLTLQNVGIMKTNSEEIKSCLNATIKGLKRSAPEETIKSKTECFLELFKKRSKTEPSLPDVGLVNEKDRTVNSISTTGSPKVEEMSVSVFKNKSEMKNLKANIIDTSSTTEEMKKTISKVGNKIKHSIQKEETEERVNENLDLLLETIKNESHHDDLDNTALNSSETLDHQNRKTNKNVVTLDFSLINIREALETAKLIKKNTEQVNVKFYSKINPDSNEKAEKELQKHITKVMFKEMSIIGQFNYGFIITKLKDDLFIVDQHATDEKYNFEQLQATTVLEHQVLVNPKSLELTAANESILIDNEEVFRKNGFTFKIDHNAECTKKVSLTGIPMSRNYIFGKDDIEEMLFMLQDSGNTLCRPSRVRSMFASRACRKSVMIGHPLSQSDMRKLIDHMGEVEHPWNCPHGRPTIRHLINLNLVYEN